MRFIKSIFKLRLKMDLAFRVDVFFNFFTQLVYLIGILLLFRVIYLNVNEIAGFNIGDVYALLGTYFILIEVYNMTFRGGILSLPETVKEGNLEIYLLKPVNTIAFILLKRVNIGRVWRILPGFILLIYGLKMNDIYIGMNLVYYIISLILSLIIYTISNFCISLLSFWFYEVNNMFYIYDDLMEFAKYPDVIYSGIIRKVFMTIIPVIIFSSFPARILIGLSSFQEIFAYQAILLLVFSGISLTLWQRGLVKYQGRG
ncbi:MAG: ABC-2 family transporter protein [Thermoanaerobacter sp.]|nr:ABC-2 family transporter protein [Thermoanaerobacter sp.]